MNRVWKRPQYGVRSRRAFVSDLALAAVAVVLLAAVPVFCLVELTLVVVEGH